MVCRSADSDGEDAEVSGRATDVGPQLRAEVIGNCICSLLRGEDAMEIAGAVSVGHGGIFIIESMRCT